MIRIKKGLDIPISGQPTQEITGIKKMTQVALLGSDYIGMKPSMLVKVGDKVKKGQLLFIDKKTPGVHYTSPASGWIVALNRGEKRAFQSMIISVDGNDEVTFNAYSQDKLAALSRDTIISEMLESGVWTSLRTRPYSKVADPETLPHSIFVTAIDTNPLAPDIEQVLAGREEHFKTGLQILAKLTETKVYLCKAPHTTLPEHNVDSVVVHEFAGPHPAGLVGTHIHFLDPVCGNKTVWHISVQDLAMVGELFTTGRLNVDRVISLAGPGVIKPRLVRTLIGGSLATICLDELKDGEQRILSGSVLSGHTGEGIYGFLGRYHQQVTVLGEGSNRELFGWMNMGFNKYSLKNIVLSKFLPKKKFDFTTSMNGSMRSIVPSGNYEKLMPLDILPLFLFRALAVGDLDDAEKLGILELDEEDLALCNFACPSKLDYGMMLRQNLTILDKEG